MTDERRSSITMAASVILAQLMQMNSQDVANIPQAVAMAVALDAGIDLALTEDEGDDEGSD